MATKKMTNKVTTPTKQAAAVGFGLTAAAAAIAGAYFLYGSKNAAKNRKVVKGWMLKAKGEVLSAVEKAQTMTKEEYEELVTKIGKGYLAAKEMTESDLAAFTKEMHTHWKDLAKAAQPKKKAVKKAVKTVEKAVTKVVKKK